MLQKIENILALPARAEVPEDMNLPGLRMHRLKGSLSGFCAVTVKANWRMIWRFEDADAFDVDPVDYH